MDTPADGRWRDVLGALTALEGRILQRVDESAAETRRYVDAGLAEARAETQRQIVTSTAETRQHVDESIAETQRQIVTSTAETRRYIDENIAETQRQITTSTAETRRYIDESTAETRRHFGVVAEGLMTKLELVVEGVRGTNERLDRFQSEVRAQFARVDRRFLRLEARRPRRRDR